MGPTSRLVIAAAIGLALAVPLVVAVLVYRRSAGRGTGRRVAVSAGVAVSIVLSQVLAIAGLVLVVNRDFGFFPTWSSLAAASEDDNPFAAVAQPASGGAMTTDELKQIRVRGWAPRKVQPPKGDGLYRDYVVSGVQSGTTAKVVVWMPPGHEHAANAKGLPVVFVLGGAYGPVDNVATSLQFAQKAAPLIRSKQIPPFVAVMPEVNIKLPQDTECTDYPGGPQAYTWLARDVPAWAQHTLGVVQPGPRWSVLGWSLGGYCAAKLHAAEPQTFGSGASLQGYFAPSLDGSTGTLASVLQRDPALRQRSDVAWLLRNRPPARTRLLAMSSPADAQSWQLTQQFFGATKGLPGITPMVVDNAGHTYTSWREALPRTLTFLLKDAGAKG